MVSYLPKFNHCRILVIGDLMLDEYLWGTVDRISPEAPVQVVSVDREDFTLGGAGNVVNNLIALGASVTVAGVIGRDRHGERLLQKFKQLGAVTDGIQAEPGRPTTRKTRIIAANQHVLRIDRETRQEISQEAAADLSRFLGNAVPDMDIILVSDYGKGLLNRTLLAKITQTAKSFGKRTIVDPKGMDYSRYTGFSMITPNKKEAALAAGLDVSEENVVSEAGRILLQETGIPNILITCGKEGMVLFDREALPVTIASRAKQVFDVSGAGDTVIAVMGLSLASGLSFTESVKMANAAAGIVVGKVGTATVSNEELRAALVMEEMTASPPGNGNNKNE